MEKLVHIKSASEQLGISEEELNVLVGMKKIPHVVRSMTKMIKQSTIDDILKIQNPLVKPLDFSVKENKIVGEMSVGLIYTDEQGRKTTVEFKN